MTFDQLLQLAPEPLRAWMRRRRRELEPIFLEELARSREGGLWDRYSDLSAPRPGQAGYRAPEKAAPHAWDGMTPGQAVESMFAQAKATVNEPEAAWAWQHYTGEVEEGSEEPDFTLADLAGVPHHDGAGQLLSDDERQQLGYLVFRLVMASDPERGEDPPGLDLPSSRPSSRTPLRTWRELLDTALAQRDDGWTTPEWIARGILTEVLSDMTPGYDQRRLRLVPVSRETAKAFIAAHHSKLPRWPYRTMFAVGAMYGDRLVAVATAGHPSGPWKRVDQRNVLELTRVASDGSVPNAASMLVGRLLDLLPISRRGDTDAPALFVTYSLTSEEGATYKSLRQKGLRSTAFVEPKIGGGKGARGTVSEALAEEPKILWEAGPAAAEEVPLEELHARWADWQARRAPRPPAPPSGPPVAAEAFTGGGLYSLALHAEGWQVSDVCEFNEDAVQTLRLNLYPEARRCDAREWEPPAGLDLLTGGPPCQPWSPAGDQLGPDDERNFYPRLLGWTERARPRIVAWENSEKIATKPEFLAYFRWWWGEMDRIGYEGTTWVLNAADYGSPQARKRAWVVAWPKGSPWGEPLRQPPPPTHGRPGSAEVVTGRLLPWTRAWDRLVSGCCGGYGLFDCKWLNNANAKCETCFGAMGAYPANYEPATLTDDEELAEDRRPYLAQLKGGRPRVFSHPPTPGGVAEAFDELPLTETRISGYLSPALVRNIARGAPYGLITTDKTPRATDVDRDDPAALDAYLATLRRISPRSAAKLMDLPNWYEFGHTGRADDDTRARNAAYRQIGNGITVNMGRAVARHLLRALGYPTPLPGSAAATERSGLWPMDSVDPCARFPGILGYPEGDYIPGTAPLRTDFDPLARPLDSPESWYRQEATRETSEAGYEAWGGEADEYQHDPDWRPRRLTDHPPGFPDFEYFRQWLSGEDEDRIAHYERLWAELGADLWEVGKVQTGPVTASAVPLVEAQWDARDAIAAERKRIGNPRWHPEPDSELARNLAAADHAVATWLEAHLDQVERFIVGFSGGKDSIACVLTLLERGIPKDKIELWHHDVDGKGRHFMDWPCTPAYCNAFARELGFPIYHSWKEGGFEREMLRDDAFTAPIHFEVPGGQVVTAPTTGRAERGTRLRFPLVTPNLNQRWCSAYLKIDVAARAVNNQPRFQQGFFVLVTGERAQESDARSRYAVADAHRSWNRKRHIFQYRPIHGWTERQVWDAMRRHGIQPHPAYRLGFSRLSCMKCIFGNADQWATIKVLDPEGFAQVAAYEGQFGVTIHRGQSVVERARQGQSWIPKGMEALAEAALQPRYRERILINPEDWQLPHGAFKRTPGPA